MLWEKSFDVVSFPRIPGVQPDQFTINAMFPSQLDREAQISTHHIQVYLVIVQLELPQFLQLLQNLHLPQLEEQILLIRIIQITRDTDQRRLRRRKLHLPILSAAFHLQLRTQIPAAPTTNEVREQRRLCRLGRDLWDRDVVVLERGRSPARLRILETGLGIRILQAVIVGDPALAHTYGLLPLAELAGTLFAGDARLEDHAAGAVDIS